MWGVTGWVVRTWLRITVLLALGVGAAWWWLTPGWFTVTIIGAGLVEVWTLRQLVREWSYQASGTWWWTR